MFRLISVALIAFVTLGSCNKDDGDNNNYNKLKGTWRRETTDGTGPGNTLAFSLINDVPTLTFDCSVSPGPNWPSVAMVPYKFINEKLSYLNYSDNNQGYYTATSFNWIDDGELFEVEFRQILLYMSSNTVVRYKKID